ncbi:MAG TPA: ABC transporter ATP-binding protein [Luteolibacter sp.]|nr:ABC transporter ATP-binding protein [Luteolibacter sp.]
MIPHIHFDNVSRHFGGLRALSLASFQVEPGKIAALLGPNGVGKSTALKICANLMRPTSGEARVLGKPSTKLAPDDFRRLGYVAEGMDLPLWMKVGHFLAWCRPLYPNWDTALEKKLLDEFGLPLDRKLANLSRGERMKAALVSVLSYRPELLLLDEPFSGLDPLVRDQFLGGVLELAGQEGWSVLISSHDLAEIDTLVDQVIFLQQGKIVLDEESESLLSRHRKVRLLLPGETSELPGLPGNWVEVSRKGRVLQFVDMAVKGDTASRVRHLLPDAENIEISAMSLRDIFISIARTTKVRVREPHAPTP